MEERRLVIDLARRWKRHPRHPLRVSHDAGGREQRRIVEAATRETRPGSRAPEQRRPTSGAEVPPVWPEPSALDASDAERALCLSNLVVVEVDRPAEGCACPTLAIAAIAQAAADGLALDLHRALATGTSGYAHRGPFPTAESPRPSPTA